MPNSTLHFSIPRQDPGYGSRTTWNTALDLIDGIVFSLSTAVANLQTDIEALPADDVVDTGGTNAQAFFDIRRGYRGVVATFAARNALAPAPAQDDWVIVKDDGTAHTIQQRWDAGSSTWITFSGTGGGNAVIHDPQTMTAGQTVYTSGTPFDTLTRTMLVVRGNIPLIQNVDWAITDANHFTFTMASFVGEVVQVTEFVNGGPGGGGGGGGGGFEVFGETPSGVVNSTDGTNGNGDFFTAHPMLASPPPQVFISGIMVSAGTFYTFSGNHITFNTGYKPQTNGTNPETVTVNYDWF